MHDLASRKQGQSSRRKPARRMPHESGLKFWSQLSAFGTVPDCPEVRVPRLNGRFRTAADASLQSWKAVEARDVVDEDVTV